MYVGEMENEEDRKLQNMKRYMEEQRIKAVKLKMKMERIL